MEWKICCWTYWKREERSRALNALPVFVSLFVAASAAYADDENAAQVSLNLTALKLSGNGFSASTIRPTTEISYSILPRLTGRTSLGANFDSFDFILAINEDISLRVEAAGQNALALLHGLTIDALKFKSLTLSIFGEAAFTPLKADVKLKKIDLLLSDTVYSTTSLLSNRLKIKYKEEHYDAGIAAELNYNRLSLRLLLGLALLNARFEVEVEPELATLMKSRSIVLNQIYEVSVLRPFWAVGASYKIGRRFEAKADATLLGLKPNVSAGGKIAVALRF